MEQEAGGWEETPLKTVSLNKGLSTDDTALLTRLMGKAICGQPALSLVYRDLCPFHLFSLHMPTGCGGEQKHFSWFEKSP